MGAVIKGKEYRTATCVRCEDEYKTDEMTINGLSLEDVDYVHQYAPEYRLSVGEDFCINCLLDIGDKEDLFDKVARELCEESLSLREYSSERLRPDNFNENDSYKVVYRFLSNMLAGWKDLGLKRYPTEKEAIKIAKLAHPYFVWLFKDPEELEAFKHLYESHSYVWKVLYK